MDGGEYCVEGRSNGSWWPIARATDEETAKALHEAARRSNPHWRLRLVRVVEEDGE